MNTLPEAVNGFPEAVNSFPEAVNSFAEAVNSLPEAVNSFPEAVNSFPEAVNSFPEAVNSFPEAVNSFPEAVNSFPEAVNSFPEAVNGFRRPLTDSGSSPHFRNWWLPWLGRAPSHSAGFAATQRDWRPRSPRMRAKARSRIQPRARRSASAGGRACRQFAGRGGGRDNATQFATEGRYAQLLWRPPPRPHFPITTDAPRSRYAERGAALCVRASARNRPPCDAMDGRLDRGASRRLLHGAISADVAM